MFIDKRKHSKVRAFFSLKAAKTFLYAADMSRVGMKKRLHTTPTARQSQNYSEEGQKALKCIKGDKEGRRKNVQRQTKQPGPGAGARLLSRYSGL